MEKDEIFKIMLSNSVTLHQGKPYCYKCSIHTENWSDSLLHIQSEKHVALVKDYKCLCSPKLVNFCAKRSRIWVESGIVIDTIKEVKCMLCLCTISPLDNLYHIEQHISGKFHTTALSVSKLRDMSLFTAGKSLLNYKQILIENKLKVTSSSYLICIACLCTLMPPDILPHIKAKRHKKKIQSMEFDQKLLIAKSIRHDTNHNIIGDNATLEVNTLQKNDIIDKYLNHGIVQRETEHFTCSLCLCSGMLLDNALEHIIESHHVIALKNSVSIERNEVSAATETPHNRKPSGSTIKTGDPKDAVNNVPRPKWFQKEGIIAGDYNTVICTVCFCPLPSSCHDIEHLKGRRHRNALKAKKKMDILPFSSVETDLQQDTDNDLLTKKHKYKSFNQDGMESDTSNHGTGQQIMEHDISSHLCHSQTINHHMSTRNSTDCLTNRNGRYSHKSAGTGMTMPQCYSYNQFSQGIDVHSFSETKCTVGYIGGIRCLCCNMILHSQESVTDHFSNDKHEKNVKRLLECISKTHFGSSKYSALTNMNTFTEYEAFPLCNLIFPKSTEQHLYDIEITFATIKVRWKNISDTSINNGITGLLFTCNVCYVKLNNPLHLIEHLSGRRQTTTTQEISLNMKQSCVKNEEDNLLPDTLNKLSINNQKQKEYGPKEFVIPPDICDSILQMRMVKRSPVKRRYINMDSIIAEAPYTLDFIAVDMKMYNFEILKHGCIIQTGPAKRTYVCVICEKTIANDKQDLVQHIFYCNKKKGSAEMLEYLSRKLIGETELSRTELIHELESYMDKWYWYSINRFCCLLCCFSFTNKSQFVNHILIYHNPTYDKLIFEGCMSCSTLWLTKKALLKVHEHDETHTYLKESKLFYVEALPTFAGQLLKKIEVVVEDLINLSEIVLISNDRVLVSYTQFKLKISLESFLKTILDLSSTHVKVYFYGPRSTGLTFNESNLYIVYELVEGNVIEDIYEDCDKDWYVMPGANEGQTVKQICHKEISMVCDIRSIDDADIRKSEILRLFCERYQPCRRVILFLKKWLSCCCLHGHSKISEEALTWLVIFSLQANSHLPSVELHQAEQHKCQEPREKLVSPETIQSLLVEFFTFYMDFDYRQYVISPFMGHKIRKENFIEIDTIPTEMHQYFKKHATGRSSGRYFDMGNSLCLQDPVDLNCNLTKNVQTVTLKHFREYCKKSLTALLDT